MFRIGFSNYAFCKVIGQTLRIVLCNSNGKQTQLLWVFVFVNEHSGKFTNHWNLNEFRFIYRTVNFISLLLTCPRTYLFSDLVKFVRPYIHISIGNSMDKFS